MKLILEFNEFKNLESKTRTKKLSDDEFLSILKTNCKNFSFNNDQLWRKTNNTFGELGLFFESNRKGTIGKYNYNDFFDTRKDYIVPRYKSLIGSTTKKGADYFGSDRSLYLVIPFDDINIIFAGTPDLAMWSITNQVFSDRLFILEKYINNFKIPKEKLDTILSNSSLNDMREIINKRDFGFEFFTNGNCLLIHESKIDWLKRKYLIC